MAGIKGKRFYSYSCVFFLSIDGRIEKAWKNFRISSDCPDYRSVIRSRLSRYCSSLRTLGLDCSLVPDSQLQVFCEPCRGNSLMFLDRNYKGFYKDF